ncbi:hypothetical protein ATY78_26900 [Rhizobium sp. R635]|nr:hypothetical protein ATY78_26900 [Rhizobium sp. R635]
MIGEKFDCLGLDLASYRNHEFVVPFISVTWRTRFFVNDMSRERFVESHELPSVALAAITTSSDLPDTHNVVPLVCRADRVDLNDADKAVISQLKALSQA